MLLLDAIHLLTICACAPLDCLQLHAGVFWDIFGIAVLETEESFQRYCFL